MGLTETALAMQDRAIAAEARVAKLEAAIREALPNVYAMADPPRARQILEHALKFEK
jgi:hypothetical protein